MHLNAGYLGLALVLLGATLLASPTLGFETIAADRGTEIETAADVDAVVGFEATTEAITGRQDTATAFYLRNNADQTLTLSTSTQSNNDLVVATDGSGSIAPGEATRVVLECSGGGSAGTATVTTTVDATGSSISVQGASSSTSVDYDCTGGGGGSGRGFQSASAGDVTVYTTPGADRQTVSFVPAHNLDQSSVVTIDLSAAHPDGVDYSETGSNFDVSVVQGGGDVVSVSSDGVIEYQTGGSGNTRDKKGDTVELSIGSYATTTADGPFIATITRTDNGETTSTSFEVVDDGDRPIQNVDVTDVPPNVQPADEDTQTFSFTFGAGPTGSDQLSIDLSDPQGDGVDYEEINWDDRDVVVQSGNGNAWYSNEDNAIYYQASDADAEGDTIVLEVQGYATDSSGGPYTVDVYWDRYNYEGTDSFSIN